MKSNILYISMLLCAINFGVSQNMFGQTNKTETIEFKVSGICKMCKDRIENAALIKGVKFAEWNKETDVIKVIFNPQKTTKETIQKSIAKAGHDTEAFQADKEDYDKLSKCCKYRENSEKH